MADLTFNTVPGETVDRAFLVLYLNTGEEGTPAWSPIGKRVEDSSEEYDWGEESKTDIFGHIYTTMKKPTITQTFDPCELDASDVAQVKIWNLAVKEQNAQALTNMDMLVVHLYALRRQKLRSLLSDIPPALSSPPVWGRGRRKHRDAHRCYIWRNSHHRTAAVKDSTVTFSPDSEG